MNETTICVLIDPARLACEEYLLAAVRQEWPDADVRAVTSGGRQGGTLVVDGDATNIDDEVDAVVRQAWEEWCAAGRLAPEKPTAREVAGPFVWRRTDTSDPDFCETITLVRVKDGEEYGSEDLGRATPFLVQIEEEGARVVLADLDGDVVDIFQVGEWEVAQDAPEDVVNEVESGFASGSYVMTEAD